MLNRQAGNLAAVFSMPLHRDRLLEPAPEHSADLILGRGCVPNFILYAYAPLGDQHGSPTHLRFTEKRLAEQAPIHRIPETGIGLEVVGSKRDD